MSAMEVAAMAGAEVAKAVLIVLIQELMKRGMTADQIDALYQQVKAEFLQNKPESIPDR